MTDSLRNRRFLTDVTNACAVPIISAVLIIGSPGCTSQQSATTVVDTKPAGVDYYVQALAANKAGKPDESIGFLEKAVAVNPDLRMARIMLGDAYRNKGDYQRAATQYEAATKLDQYTAANHYNLGLAYQFLNRLQASANAYLRALQLNPKDVKSNMNLGLVYLALGDSNSAVYYLQRATQLDPNSFEAWTNLGVAYDARGNAGDAEKSYRKAIELKSDDPVTLQNLAQNLISQQRTDEAIQVMRTAVATGDSPAAHKRFGDALVAAKRFDEAVTEYDIALKADPQFAAAMSDKGFAMIGKYVADLYLDDKLRTGAVDLWRASLRINPAQPRVIEALRKWEHPGLFGA